MTKPYVSRRRASCLSPIVVAIALAAGSLAASAQPAADYCKLLTKDDVEAALKIRVTNVRPSPLKPIPSTQMHDQTCLFEAGSRILRITVTETLSPSQAQSMFNTDIMGHSMMSGAKPAGLPGIGDEAVVVADTVVMRKGKLVLDFSVADFASSDTDRLALAKALAQKAAEKIE